MLAVTHNLFLPVHAGRYVPRKFIAFRISGESMAAPQPLKYYYRAYFRPDGLDVFKGFDRQLDWKGRGQGYAVAWHRSNWESSPFAIWNELICGEIGRFLRLPVPPFAMTRSELADNARLFTSLDFACTRAKLPRIIPEFCVQRLEPLCAGVLAFDILIANEDRHDENLVVDQVMQPREMHVYDHDQALLGGCRLTGLERLVALRDRLGITGSTVTGGNRHVFLDLITRYASLSEWCARIRMIPDWFIESVCAEARAHGLDKKISQEAAFFLKYRRDRIHNLIEGHKDAFAIGDWPRQQRLC
jgi:hypothetical protein